MNARVQAPPARGAMFALGTSTRTVLSLLLIASLDGCRHVPTSHDVGSPCPEVAASRGASRAPNTGPQGRACAPQSLDNRGLEELLRRHFRDLDGDAGRWLVAISGVPVMVITDEAADRMRAMAIVSEQPIDPERMRVLLEADFDTALDAKYALWEGKLWSVFVHPLSTLSDSEVTNGIVQVVNLVKTYGSSYSSTDMQFSPGSRQPTPGAEL